jgi:hypothetical protein
MNEYNAEGRRIHIQVWYPELPPSTNHIYSKGSRLTDEARAYKERFKQYMQQNFGHQINEFVEANNKGTDPKTGELIDVSTKDPNLIFMIQLIFYMDLLTSWGNQEVFPSQRARFRFKTVDLTNRVKFVEDCFKYSIGLDDSLTFVSTQMKVHNPAQEGVMITYYAVPPEQFGVPHAEPLPPVLT